MVKQGMHQRFVLEDKSYSSLTKKAIHSFASHIGFEEVKLGEVDIVVSEMISNLFKHASKGGEILIKELRTNDAHGIEIICIDQGPGIPDLIKMMNDGTSTSDTLGHGLGSMSRLSDTFEIYSLVGWGTIVLSRFFLSPLKRKIGKEEFSVNGLMIAKPGEKECGDNWFFIEEGNQLNICLVDGLGHGPEAAQAANIAIDRYIEYSQNDICTSIRRIHENLKKTRGVVGLLLNLNFSKKSINFCGVGNIAGRLFSYGSNRNFISYNGIIGHALPNTLNPHILTWDKSDLLILTSDGIKTRWELDKYTGILSYDNSIIAAAIYKDHCRFTDDATIIVARTIKMKKKSHA